MLVISTSDTLAISEILSISDTLAISETNSKPEIVSLSFLNNNRLNKKSMGSTITPTNTDKSLELAKIMLDSVNKTIENSDKKFAIQGKAPSSLTTDEIINIGFKTTINVATLYTLSAAKLEGYFLTGNPVYLKDNLTNTIHDLSASDYNFTSEVGEFTNRFEIVFKAQALSADTFDLDANTVQIIQLDDTHVTFKASGNLNIKTVTIYDLLGRQLYQLEGSQNEETYDLSNLQHSVFIAKVALSNGALVTKKAIKK